MPLAPGVGAGRKNGEKADYNPLTPPAPPIQAAREAWAMGGAKIWSI